MPDQESVRFDIDPRSVLSAVKEMNAAMEGWEKGTAGAHERLQKAIERQADLLLKVNDRSRNSLEKLTQSIEKQAAAYGKTNADRMIAERDRIIKKLGDEQGMIERVNAAYAKMLAADAAGQGAAGMEKMGFAAQQSKASLALMGEEIGVHIPRQLRTFITMLPGVGQALDVSFKAVAIIALVAVIYEAVKKVLEFRKALEDLHSAAEKNAAEFDRYADSQRLANLELKTTNDQLESAIAKLQHKPENNLATAIDEAAAAALRLSDRMDKSLRSFAELAQKNAPGMFAEILGRQAGTKDITELIQGKSGFGGMIGAMYSATNTGGDPTGVLTSYRARVQRLLETAVQSQAFQEGRLVGGGSVQLQPGTPVTYNPALGPVESTAQQGPRIEVLNALIRQIDILAQSYTLEKQHATLQNTENQLKDALSKSGAFVISDAQMEKMRAGAPVISGRPSLYPQSAALTNAQALGWKTEVTVTQSEIDKANAPLEAERKAQMEARFKGEEDLIKKTDAERLSDIETQAKYTERVLQLRKGPGGEIELARTVAQVREDALRKEFDLTGDAVKYREQSLANERDMRLKIAEVEIKQHDELAKTATTLWNTLLTKPQDFGKQLGTTVRGAVLKPVTEGLGNLTANALGPMIFGESGTGGMAGLFGNLFGRNDPVKTATDQNTLATRQNSQALYLMSGLIARQSGISLSSLPTPTVLPGTAALPKFAEGGVTSGPTIVGEAGPELVIPLSLRPTMNRPLVGTYGPQTDIALMKAAMGLSNVGLAGGLSVLGGPGAYEAGTTLMSMLLGGVAAMSPDRRDNVLLGVMPTGPGGGKSKWQRIQAGEELSDVDRRLLFGKTEADLGKQGSKGGRISGLRATQAAAERDALRAAAREMAAEERDALMREKGLYSDADYKGPKDWDRYIGAPASASSRQLDERFPWLANLDFAPTEAELRRQALGRAGGLKRVQNLAASQRAPRDLSEMRARGSTEGSMLWAINPDTGGVRLGQYIPSTMTARKEGLFETHADWFEKIHFPVAGEEFDRIPRGYAQIKGGRIHIIDNGLEEEQEGLTSPPLTKDQYARLVQRVAKQFKLPGYDEGGTVAATGMAVVHQGEAIMPSADTLKRAIEANTAATERAAMAQRASVAQMAAMASNITGWLLAGIGVAAPRFGGGTAMGGNVLGGGGGATWAPGGDLSAVLGAPGGTSGFAGPVGDYDGGGYAGGGVSPGGLNDIYNLPSAPHSALNAMLRQGSKPGGIWTAGGLGRLKSSFGIGTASGPWTADPATGGMVSSGTTTFRSVATSQAVKGLAMAGGTMLAEQGLMGSSRGTWGGVAEGTVGGAGIGFAIGGPLGAGIGAAAGFGIGVGEKLAGVMSPENEAKKLAKQIYGISIDTSTAKQVAAIAQQKYAGNVGVAVRDPDVRKMLMLYSEATGQHMPLSATTPMAGSLAEMNGRLYQQATWMNGTPYAMKSDLPVLGGYGDGSAPMMLQLNVSGQGAAQFVAGQVVTPEFVQAKWSSAASASNGRLQNSAMIQQPGLLVS